MSLSRNIKLTCMILLLGLSFSARATLGSAPSSLIEPYTYRLQVQMQTSTGVTYQVVIQQNTQGMVFKEFVFEGVVFAQTWFGAALPNLSLILGDIYYPRYEAMLTTQTLKNHRQVQITDQELYVINTGRMGDFWGMSYLNSHMPQGFSVNDIQ